MKYGEMISTIALHNLTFDIVYLFYYHNNVRLFTIFIVCLTHFRLRHITNDYHIERKKGSSIGLSKII